MKQAAIFILSVICMASVAGQIKSVSAARKAISAIDCERYEIPYVTSGLIAMWDGEWNTGIGANTTFVVDSVFKKDTLLMTVYINGIEVGSKTIADAVWNLDGQDVFLQMGANSGALNDGTGFRLFSVMLYDRCLTEEEIQYNFMIDCERFGL